MAAKANVSRTHIVGVERGSNTSLPYLRSIARGLKLTDEEWYPLLVDWIALQIGPKDLARLSINCYVDESGNPITDPHKRLTKWCQGLSPNTAELMVKAIEHPGFHDLVRALTRQT